MINFCPKLLQRLDPLTGGLGVKSILCQDELPVKFRSVWDPDDPEVVTRLFHWWSKVTKSLDKEENRMSSRTFRQVIGR